MRRRRSETIDAQTYDEFLRLSQASTSTSKPRARNSLPESNLFTQITQRTISHFPQIPPSTFNKQKEPFKAHSTSVNYWEGLDFDCRREINTPTTNASSAGSSHKPSIDRDNNSEIEEECVCQPVMNRIQVMIVGSKGSGRHKLVNALFDEEEDHGIRMPFDLVIKRKDKKGELELFKFWIKDACKSNYSYLFKSYYKAIPMYIFIYRINDRLSFECLEEAIREVKDDAMCNNFIGFIIGAKEDDTNESTRKVSYQEGEELKNKYQLFGFLETGFKQTQEHDYLFNSLFPRDSKI